VTKEVAEQLGNKPAVAKKYYMHPAVIDSYCSGTLAQELGTPRGDRRVPRRGLSEEEEAVVRLLKLHRQRSRMTTVELLEVSVRASKRG
jgi:DNA topoisomerase-1